MKKNWVYTLWLVLIIVWWLNRWLVWFFNFDLVATIFGEMSLLSRIVYSLVWVSALYVLADLLWVFKK